MTYPPTRTFTNLEVWAEAGPPKGTLYHYPNPYNHQKLWITASPAPPKIARQIAVHATMTKMVLRYTQGEPLEKNARPGGGRVRRLHADLKTERRLGHLTDRKSTRSCLPLDGRFDLEAT
jgi:hypothetical protein